MWKNNALTDLLGIDYPIIQAPMAGAATSEMASAVSGGGGLGSMGCAQMTMDEVTANAVAIRAITDKPFNFNFFAHQEPADYDNPDVEFIAVMTELYQSRGLGPLPVETNAGYPSFNQTKLETLLEIKPAVVSFHFGLPDDAMLLALKQAGCRLMCSATTVTEALYLESKGMDAVIAQGWEAGGHRGTFEVTREDFGIGSMALIPQIVDAIKIPVVAAGGIADGRGIAAAIMLGASAVQVGSAFLSCPEASLSDSGRKLIAAAQAEDTRLTRAFTGRPARGKNNIYIETMAQRRFRLPEFPVMSRFSKPLVQSSEANDDNDFCYQLYGQATALNREMSSAELLATLVEETDRLLG